MGQFKVIVPEETVNLVANPSIELGTTGYAAVGGSIARSSTRQRFGLYSLAVTPSAGVNDGYYYGAVSLTSGQAYTRTVYVWGVAGVPYKAYFATADGALKGTATEFVGTGAWQRVTVTWTADATASFRLYVTKNNHASTGVFYADGEQVEEKAYATTYVDGSLPGCYWNGVKHASTSTRRATSRAGGRVRDLYDDLSFLVAGMQGMGMPGIQNQQTEYAILPGSIHEGAKVGPASPLLTGTLKAASLSDLHTKRRALIDAFKPDLKTKEPAIIQYTGSGSTLELPVHYEAGLALQMKRDEGLVCEQLALQLTAPAPFWRAEAETVAALDEQAALTVNHIAARINGQWTDLDGGMDAVVRKVRVAPDGSVYAIGEFATAGGNAASCIAKWDGTAWSALGAGITSTGTPYVYDLAIAPNGDVYVTGDFTAAGGNAAANIAKWDGSSWSALGTGLTGGVGYALAIDPDGTVFVGGEFTAAGGSPASCIAAWDGSAWAALGTGLTGGDTSPECCALVIAPDGTLYAGGIFTAAGGTAANNIAAWDGSAWSALGAGVTGDDIPGYTVYALACDEEGRLYAGGLFAEAGGVDAKALAVWNGTAWSALGGPSGGLDFGISTHVGSLCADEGRLYVAGDFEEIGGLALTDRCAIWDGTSWSPLDITLPAGAPTDIYAKGGNLYLGHVAAGTAYASGKTTVANAGSVEAYPVITIARSGGTSARLQSIRNRTTGEEMLFNYSLADGEELTIDLTPGAKKITSSAYGNVLGALLAGSDFATFSLAPGPNDLYLYVSEAGSPTVTAFVRYRAQYWGVDA